MTTIAELRKMLEAATHAPWRVENNSRLEIRAGELREMVAHIYRSGKADGVSYGMPAHGNAELIVALRNLAPSLLDALEAADELREAARKVDAQLDTVGSIREGLRTGIEHRLVESLAKYDNARKGITNAR